MPKFELLNVSANAKTIKSDEFSSKYLTAILYLAPATTSGIINTCPSSTAGCRAACLFTAGRGVYHNVQEARKRKTKEFKNDKQAFLLKLRHDIAKFEEYCHKIGKMPAVRLNGTSDIQFEHFGIMQDFPGIQFYDYTAIVKRLYNKLPNYHLTFSRKEDNEEECKKVLAAKLANVAVVFESKDLLNEYLNKNYLNRQVINGDEHDLRFLDKPNSVVALYAKGKAKKDTTGFVIRK